MADQKAIIFAPTNDAHASAMKWALNENGMETVWAPSLYLGATARFAVQADADGIEAISPWGDPSRIASAWARFLRPPQIDGLPDFDNKFVHKQWEFFQRNAFELADDMIDGLWINRPTAAHTTESKLLQLKVANEVGLLIPETVVTNDAGAVRRLIERCGKIVSKQFYDYMWRDVNAGKLYSSSPAVLDARSDLPEDSIGICPSIYQRYIQKAFDLRVTVIGERIFSAKLQRAGQEAFVDWRPHVYQDELSMSAFNLPEVVERKVRALLKRLGLVFGCIDLVVDHDGNYYFLEINQQGQFLFVEEQVPELPLLQAMSAMMREGRVDYSMDNGKNISFAEYLKSEEYQRILAAPLDKSDIYVVEA